MRQYSRGFTVSTEAQVPWSHSIHHLNFIVRDLEAAIPVWERILGAPVARRDELTERGVIAARFRLGDTWLVLVQPTREDSVPGPVPGGPRRGLLPAVPWRGLSGRASCSVSATAFRVRSVRRRRAGRCGTWTRSLWAASSCSSPSSRSAAGAPSADRYRSRLSAPTAPALPASRPRPASRVASYSASEMPVARPSAAADPTAGRRATRSASARRARSPRRRMVRSSVAAPASSPERIVIAMSAVLNQASFQPRARNCSTSLRAAVAAPAGSLPPFRRASLSRA